jgi:hypothetical protein
MNFKQAMSAGGPAGHATALVHGLRFRRGAAPAPSRIISSVASPAAARPRREHGTVQTRTSELRRQIAVLTLSVDETYEFGEVLATPVRDLAQFIPENVFETDARSMAANHNRPLQNPGSQISAVRRPLHTLFEPVGTRLG